MLQAIGGKSIASHPIAGGLGLSIDMKFTPFTMTGSLGDYYAEMMRDGGRWTHGFDQRSLAQANRLVKGLRVSEGWGPPQRGALAQLLWPGCALLLPGVVPFTSGRLYAATGGSLAPVPRAVEGHFVPCVVACVRGLP